jgi:hypothetical protein
MFALMFLCAFVMNVTTEALRDDVLSVAHQEFLMHTTAENVLYKKRIGMDAQKSSI